MKFQDEKHKKTAPLGFTHELFFCAILIDFYGGAHHFRSSFFQKNPRARSVKGLRPLTPTFFGKESSKESYTLLRRGEPFSLFLSKKKEIIWAEGPCFVSFLKEMTLKRRKSYRISPFLLLFF